MSAAERWENRKAPDFAIFQEISFPEPDRSPLVLRGESCSVNAGYGGDYCIYADVYHMDGTVRYSIKAKWRPGTHPWEETAICHEPDKPVSKVIVYVLLQEQHRQSFIPQYNTQPEAARDR